ncbi:LANO_0F07426g1_1 [Lachancea nothofagi CBS 11611]|uniref:Actin cytoskeleton-regulatory complex protein SLA1 n=1 Tax=Lachancea nothofagi CBS 11611 TaxID=1266666 RepID=A0A1G4K8Z6_9SACH|nr:LANO_0F07426g1_1 [Lachancea nothofagi CBS 11611]
MTLFLGIYKAIFQYVPQSEEELAVEEDDLLYLLQKSEVDDWWSVKKRVIGSDTEEPVGLVPSNYIEEADVKFTAVALYDYPEVQNADEEIVFSENDILDVFDDRDPDWILCRSQRTGEYGFVPGNYVEPASGPSAPLAAAASAPAAPAAPAVSAVNVSSFPPPPQHAARATQAAPAAYPSPPVPDYEDSPPKMSRPIADEDEVPPPRPTRPREDTRDIRESTYDSYEDREAGMSTPVDNDGKIKTWDVSEVNGKKKHKAKFAIGKSTIFFKPAKGTPQQWPVNDLMTYDNEKKHIFFEFSNPYLNLEIHTGSTSVADEIMAILGELKGAYRAGGLREVEAASKPTSKPPSKSSHRKQGKAIYDFIGESVDELSVKEGEIVHILDDKKSKDWWMCESADTGRVGVVPAQFVEPINQLSAMANSLKSLGKSSKKSTSNNSSKNWKDDAEQEVSKKSSTRKRSSSFLHPHKKKEDERTSSKKHKDFPDSKKTRVWVDRSGTFKVEAEFIGCVEGKVHLHKVNGVKIAVAADKLCLEDLERVERLTGTSLDKYKPKSASNGSSARDKERERRRRLKEQDDREREREQRELDRRLREQELNELRKARDLLDKERENMRAAQERELPPIKPPRPSASSNQSSAKTLPRSSSKAAEYDWFEFFLNCGVDVNNCQRYTINFEREQISEETLSDIQPSVLRTLGLREGDIIRVMKYLDQKFGRENTMMPTSTGGLFSEPDGSIKVPSTDRVGSGLPENLLPQKFHPSTGQNSSAQDDEAWTVKPAATSEATMPPQKSEFTGSMQDLLDLQPLEPKKAPQPKFKDLEPVKTGSSRADNYLASDKTGGTMAPLDPFKTGGHNLLPMATGGFVMVPVSTGGLIPLQRTGGILMPQTTFGMQPTGTILPVQKTGNGLIPYNTGGLMPQTTFGIQGSSNFMPLQRTGGTIPLQQNQFTGTMMGSQNTGGPMNMPQTSFGIQSTGVMPMSATGGNMMPNQMTGASLPFGTSGMGLQNTIPQTSFGYQSTGGFNGSSQPGFMSQITGGANMMPATSFGNQMTGGANMMPTNSFQRQVTGGLPTYPQTTFGMPNQLNGNFGMGTHSTGGVGMMPQNSFNVQRTGGMQPLPQPSMTMHQTGGFQPQSQFGLGMQRTGGVSLPQTSFNTGGAMQQPLGNSLTGGISQLNSGFQNMSVSQPALQSQPTGFGFGNGPQPQQKHANMYNASADNPFGF